MCTGTRAELLCFDSMGSVNFVEGCSLLWERAVLQGHFQLGVVAVALLILMCMYMYVETVSL